MRNIEFVPKAFEEHRLIYKITDTSIIIFSCYYYYQK